MNHNQRNYDSHDSEEQSQDDYGSQMQEDDENEDEVK